MKLRRIFLWYKPIDNFCFRKERFDRKEDGIIRVPLLIKAGVGAFLALSSAFTSSFNEYFSELKGIVMDNVNGFSSSISRLYIKQPQNKVQKSVIEAPSLFPDVERAVKESIPQVVQEKLLRATNNSPNPVIIKEIIKEKPIYVEGKIIERIDEGSDTLAAVADFQTQLEQKESRIVFLEQKINAISDKTNNLTPAQAVYRGSGQAINDMTISTISNGNIFINPNQNFYLSAGQIIFDSQPPTNFNPLIRFQDSLSVIGGVSQEGVSEENIFEGNIDARNGLNITNASLTVAGTSFIVDTSGNITSAGTLTVGGATDFAGDLTISGNMGIGTATPLEILDVGGRLRLAQTTAPITTIDKLYNVSGNLFWNGAQLTGGGGILPSGATGQTLYYNGSGWTASSNLFHDGDNVGIGTTSPLAKLDVFGNIVLSGASAGRYINFGNTVGTSGYGFYDSSGTIQFKNSGGSWSAIQAYDAELGEIAALADTKGNLIAGNGSAWAALTVGTDNYVLTASSTATNGVTWQPAGSYLAIDNLSDVVITSAAAGDFIMYDGTNWVDFATSSLTIDLTKSSGTLPLSKGGTNKSASASAGSVAYSDSDSYEFTAVGTTGQLLMSNNTSAPSWISTSSLAISSDNIVQGSTNKFTQWTTSGSNIYYNTGSVGIGTTSPNSLLEIYSSSADVNFTLTSATAGNDPLLTFRTSTAPSANFILGVDNTDNSFRIATSTFGTNDVFVIDSNGNVGIGTSTPAYLLHLSDSVDNYLQYAYNTNTGTSSGGLYVRSDGTGNLLTLNYDGTDIMTVSDAQTAFNNPVYFASAGDVSISNNLILTDETAAFIDFYGPGYIRTDSSWQDINLTLSAANAGYVVIDDTFQNNLSSTATSAASEYGIYQTLSDTGIVTTGTDITYGLYQSLSRTGATGGTIDSYGMYLSVAGDTGGTSTAIGGYLSATGADSNYGLLVANGNVGIGTTTPIYALDVKATGTDIARFIGSNSTGCSLSEGGVISCSSDIALKNNIEEISYGLNEILRLRPVEFNWKGQDDEIKSLGFIAQEVGLVMPQLVNGVEGAKQLNTIGLIPVLAKAVQELSAKMEASGIEQVLSVNSDGYAVFDEVRAREITTERLKTKELDIEQNADEKKNMVGTGVLKVGEDSVSVENKLVTEKSKIFITFKENIRGADWWICEQKTGISFSVCLSKPVDSEVRFDYLIIGFNK